MVWLRTLFWLIAIGLLALIVRLTSGDVGALVTVCLGLAGLLAWHLLHLQRLLVWLQDLRQPPPTAKGSWEDVFVNLYRQRRQRDRELAEARETVQSWLAASQALPDGVVTLTEDFHIDWCNREARRMLGLRLPADRGQHLLNLVRSPEFVRYAQQSEWPEPRVVPGPGRPDRHLLVQVIPYGRHQHLLVARDVTQIERLETMRRDFVANVSHELRTPLTVLVGFLETLRDAPAGALSAEQRTRFMDLMREQTQRMQSIVADLLTLSTLESSRASERPNPAGMGAIIETVRQQASALSGGQHTIRWHLAPALDVLGTASELSSAVSNLVTNAIRYTPAGGTITVEWQPTDEGGAMLSVSDTGIGIEPQHLPRLTERFYRVDRSRSRASGGTGLGLAITKHVVIRHDAELKIASDAGRGSTFSIVFPRERVVQTPMLEAVSPEPA
ncbi:phosphate regulon sensor histidine kinase PhoR [Verticiella sediminum]|uniref:Phosphate regulon sensor protein PhoR n=1 Tax=Verticiella sediminum TaxID=1247510 RepID=A0A556ALZ1_9BURK|nr:phosphate regulon sensor histidine kinase PhoR [Verticiella sediminum]TSH93914.1 phosphate regulon sensor histidine kinase PhoR [Verticiella sediminum]